MCPCGNHRQGTRLNPGKYEAAVVASLTQTSLNGFLDRVMVYYSKVVKENKTVDSIGLNPMTPHIRFGYADRRSTI